MFFRELFFAAFLLAATPMTAQIIEDVSMLTTPGASESTTPEQALWVLLALDPDSLVLVTWKDGTTSTATAEEILKWYDAPE